MDDTQSSVVKLRGYMFLVTTNLYGNQCSNAALLIRQDIPHQSISLTSEIRFTAARVYLKKWYTIGSVYLPPNIPLNIQHIQYFIKIMHILS